MLKLSYFASLFVVGEPANAQVTPPPAGPRIYPCSIDAAGNPTANPAGPDLLLGAPATGATVPSGEFIAERVWNAVWNDYADFQRLNDKLVYGKVYFDTIEGARICNQRCQMSVIGVASDTFGHSVGSGSNYGYEVPIAVAGWVLAYTDKEYPCGTPLTNDENGNLTEMTLEEKMKYPERLVGIYKKRELNEFFGPEHKKVKVDGRHWVKVK